jgi:Fe2+ or Zn2+ uptake regulation protein
MRAKKYHITLTDEERNQLNRVVASNKRSIRQRIHARVLLAADTGRPGGSLPDDVISKQSRTSLSTVYRLRQRFAEIGLQSCLRHKPQQNRKKRVLDGVAEAHLIALACGAAPEGHKQWSLHLLRDRLIEQGYVDTVSHETVRQTLKKIRSSRG